MDMAEVFVGLMPSVNEISAIVVTGDLLAETVVRAVEQCMDGCAQVRVLH